ncbi:MAG: hypothetical protein EOP07_05885 [Proteobacteria bacterium]|nr:MAG: hypothetical protein EOP07_05885 [Pseudomonadota bacterium]
MMNNKSLLSLVVLTLITSACGDNKFSEASATGQSYRVNVQDDADSSVDTNETTGEDSGVTSTPDGSVTQGEEKDDQLACSKLTGVKQSKVKISGSQQDIVISKTDALAFRVTGNQNVVTVDLSVPFEGAMKAICIFVAGNKNQVKIDNANHISAIYVVARGNHAQVDIANRKGSMVDVINLDAKGNSASLVLTGEGTYPCDKGNAAVVCE